MQSRLAQVQRLRIITARGLASSAGNSVVVVGGGRLGAVRLDAITRNPRSSVAGFVDMSGEVKAAVASRYGCPTFGSIADAVAATNASAVWVCAPTFAHTSLIKEACELGMHVAVEKPVAETLEEIHDCYDAAAAANVHLFCSFQRRFDPHYLALYNQVQEGRIGSPAVIHTVFRDSPCPPIEFLKTGGDPFHDLFVHDIDFVRYLLGGDDEVVEVFASGTSFNDELRAEGVMDTAVTRVKFASGTVYNGEFTRFSTYGYDQRCEVYGSNGSMARVINPSTSEAEVFDGRGHVRDQVVYSFLQRYPAAYDNEVDHFLDVLEDKASLRVTKRDATLATVISEAALQSAKRNAVVKISYEGKHPEFSTLEMRDGQPSLQTWSSYQ